VGLEVDQNQSKKPQWKKHLHSAHQVEGSGVVSGEVAVVIVEDSVVEVALEVVVTGVALVGEVVDSEVVVDSEEVEVDLMGGEVDSAVVEDLLDVEDSKVEEAIPVMEIVEVVVDEADTVDHQGEATLEVVVEVVTEEVAASSKYQVINI
jgi:hypothetical protein